MSQPIKVRDILSKEEKEKYSILKSELLKAVTIKEAQSLKKELDSIIHCAKKRYFQNQTKREQSATSYGYVLPDKPAIKVTKRA